MAEKVGSVYIEASVDTTGVIQAGKAISGVADKMESDLKSVGNAADTMSDKLNESGKSVSRFGIELSTADQKLGRFIDLQGRVREATGRFTTGMLANGESVKSFNQNISAAGNETEKTGNKLSGFGRNATAVGVQLQDIAVQAQAGTSAFVILGQQGSQLASSFGPGGAVFGAVIAIASAIGGVLYTSLKNASGAMKELPEEMQKQLEEIKKRYSEIDEASRAAFTQVELGKINTQYEKQKAVVDGLKSSIKFYSEEIKNGNQAAGQNVLALTIRLKSAQKELENIASLQTRVGQELAGANVTGKLEDGLKDSTNAAEQLAAQLQTAVLKITDGELAARRYAAAQTLGLKAGEQLPQQIDDLIVKHYQLEEALKLNNEQRKAALELQRESRAELDRELQAELAAIDAKNKAQANVSGIIAGGDGSPAAKAAAEAEAKIAVLQRDAAAQLITAEQAAEAIIAVEDQKQAELTRIANEGAEKRKQFSQQATQSTLGAFGDLFGNLADIAKEGGEKTFKQYKMLASAQAAISAALAITNVLANPLIPYPLNVGLAASVGALAAVQIAKIQGQQYSAGGGRLYGGPVQAGGMYPVTEDGRPEILKQGNRQYLLPGSRGGEVVSNRDMQQAGGGGGIVINYNPTIYAQDADFEAIMAGQPEAVLNAVRMGLASEGRTL